MDFKIDPETMNTIVSKAIFDSMTAEKRDEILETAIRTLMTPTVNSYNKKMPPLQEAFNFAVKSEASRIVRELLEQDASVKERLRSVCTDAINRAFLSETVVDKIAGKIGTILSGGEY